MTAQEIKDGMTQGEWVSQEREITLYTTHEGNLLIGKCDSSETTHKTDRHNADAICLAVNATWNSNIDPAKVPEMHKLLDDISLDIDDIQSRTEDSKLRGELLAVFDKLYNMYNSSTLK